MLALKGVENKLQEQYNNKKYFTINNQGSSEQTIQKSRFIGYAKRVESEIEAQKFIQQIKKTHYDARHNCFAYLIGENSKIQKANDDGEPGGTAGIPILEVIKMKELKNTVIVVSRYFGGIKLGAGGLIRAYSSTASQTVDKVGILERKLVQEYSVKIDYSNLGKIQNSITDKDSKFFIDDIIFQDIVILNILVDAGQERNFKNWIIEFTNNQVEFSKKEMKYIDIPKSRISSTNN